MFILSLITICDVLCMEETVTDSLNISSLFLDTLSLPSTGRFRGVFSAENLAVRIDQF